ncbi:ReoY family proteolytic degradation factor [Indiicoccus explosivorum]|uniref:ReoY family proteolytic degradation factor n=1 Tax=Indiicoccus explosivorum TaxID=1917864 RepID=UPI000B4509BB|nr:ReoY family proteolytic degradation factor [Indiicoccus explosivorum]
MTASVTVNEKKQFVRWFLENHRLKRRECIWILNYMLGHDHLLEKTHFVEEAHYCPRSMVISTTDSKEVPFRFYRGHLMTADAEKTFHDLRLHPEEELYVQLNFRNMPPSPEFMAVLEENPFIPEDAAISETDRLAAEELLEESMQAIQEEALLKRIDAALDTDDREEFFRLSGLLQKLKDVKYLKGDND